MLPLLERLQLNKSLVTRLSVSSYPPLTCDGTKQPAPSQDLLASYRYATGEVAERDHATPILKGACDGASHLRPSRVRPVSSPKGKS